MTKGEKKYIEMGKRIAELLRETAPFVRKICIVCQSKEQVKHKKCPDCKNLKPETESWL